jgi:hypothetical protein
MKGNQLILKHLFPVKKWGAYLIISVYLFIAGCVKPFTSPPLSQNLNHLVVEGNIGIGSPTKIKLSRTSNINDTLTLMPELNAQLFVQSESGNTYPLDPVEDGLYQTSNGPSSFNDKYSLRIHTQDGSDYASDFVEAKQTPPIDSIEWIENNEVYIYVNTHDDLNKTKFYRWEFDETSEYTAFIDSHLDFRNGEVVFLEPEESRYTCFKFFNSKDIILGSSNGLSEDKISHAYITEVPNDNSKIAVRYSILVKQYALSAESYKFWQLMKLNSEQTGNIFDPQPAQLNSNIHSIAHPAEPVIGFISACSVSEKRLFIRQGELVVRKPSIYEKLCEVTLLSPADAPQFLKTGNFLPAYYVTGGGIAIAPPNCIDCRLQGGITTKPSYW